MSRPRLLRRTLTPVALLAASALALTALSPGATHLFAAPGSIPAAQGASPGAPEGRSMSVDVPRVGGDPSLRLRTGTVRLPASEKARTTLRDASVIVDAARTRRGVLSGARDDQHLFVAQWDRPLGQAQRTSVEDTGAVIDGYLPDHAYLLRATPAQADAVAQLDGVRAVQAASPEWKLHPSTLRRWGVTQGSRSAPTLDAQPRFYTVTVATGVKADAVRAAADRLGAVASTQGDKVFLAATDDAIASLATSSEVTLIEPYVAPRTWNEWSYFSTMRGRAAEARGYDGSTQIAAVADTGFGTGDPATAHPGTPANRIQGIYDWPTPDLPNCRQASPDGARDVDSGHGTHTATSVVGGGDSFGVGRAGAYKAKLVFQAIQDWVRPMGRCAKLFKEGYQLGGIPVDIKTLFDQAYNAGARVHSDSWGSTKNGEYDDNAAGIDAFIAAHRDMTISFAAGNGAVDKDKNGETDTDSVGAPATSKNGLAVGATSSGRTPLVCDTSLTYVSQKPNEKRTWGQNATCQSLGGRMSVPTWGAWFPSMAPVSPLKEQPQAGNEEQMAPFSGRGPTDDGRIKPDVVAPGTWILSGYSPLFRQGYDRSPNPQNRQWQSDTMGFPYSRDYKYNTGTSMANPLVAGAATVVRDYYQKRHYQNASAALVKATLVNSARDLLDENLDGRNDNKYPVPNQHEGWGLVNVDAATEGSAVWLDEGVSLDAGRGQEYQVEAVPGKPLRITLAWTDPAAKPNASATLVNNLDLEVSGPGGTFVGNAFSGGWSAPGGRPDTVNNLENVYLQNPGPGVYTVRVKAAATPGGAQNFALVLDGARSAGQGINRNPQIVAEPSYTTPLGQPVNIQLRAGDPDGDAIQFSATGLPAGLSIGAQNGLISGTPTQAGRFQPTITVTDARGGQASVSPVWNVEISTAGNTVQNGDFEQGPRGWSGDTSVIQANPNPPPYQGIGAAKFKEERNARQSLSARVQVPNTGTATLSLWGIVTTQEIGSFRALDVLNVSVDGRQVLQLSNKDRDQGWTLYSADLSAYRGRTVNLQFSMSQDKAMPTMFMVDNVAVTPGA